MKLQAKKYNKQNGTINTNQLYLVDKTDTITIEEHHSDKSLDRVKCGFDGDGELYFCEEYRPSLIPKDGHKSADIMVLQLAESAGIYIYDIKRQFKDDDEIFHYVSQINSTYYDSRSLALSAHYDLKNQEIKVGVITSNFPKDIIEQQKNYYQKELNDAVNNSFKSNIAINKSISQKIPVLKRKVEILSTILSKKLVLDDGSLHDLDIIFMNPIESGYEVTVQFGET